MTFTVNELAPVCRAIGHFTVLGHAGLNRVRFAGRLHHRTLPAGTYRISARTTAGRVVRRITLVVVAGLAPTGAELRAARAANVCAGGARGTAARSARPPQQRPASQQSSGIATPHAQNAHSGVLATSLAHTARAVRPYLVGLLALAIVLLGFASLPPFAVPGTRVNHLLVQHRFEIASLGTAVLVAVAIAFLL